MIRQRRAWIAMVLPVLRVLLRTARPRRIAVPRRLTQEVDHQGVVLPLGRTDDVVVAGRSIGTADVRHDLGSSTLEVWSDLGTADDAKLFAAAVFSLATDVGAHRVAWSLRPDSVEQLAAAEAGLVREGAVTAPLSHRGLPHELWAVVVAP